MKSPSKNERQDVPRRVVVGIPAYAHVCDTILGKKASAVPESYITALTGMGISPFIIPIADDDDFLRHVLGMIDGLMLIGGPDVGPMHYGQSTLPGLRKITPTRDLVELKLTRWALTDGLPIFAICRGIQVLNVAAGGSLWQDIASQLPHALRHDWHPEYGEDYLAHGVNLKPGSRLAEISRQGRLQVNSLHHQAIRRVGTGLTVVARADDDIVEAVEGRGTQWVLGVQWHPEWLVARCALMRALFAAFGEACRH